MTEKDQDRIAEIKRQLVDVANEGIARCRQFDVIGANETAKRCQALIAELLKLDPEATGLNGKPFADVYDKGEELTSRTDRVIAEMVQD